MSRGCPGAVGLAWPCVKLTPEGAASDPKKEEELKRLQDTIRRALRGKYHVAYERLSEADPKMSGHISIDEFVNGLILMLPTGTEAKKVRRLARTLDKDKKGLVDYRDFCDDFASKDSKAEKRAGKSDRRSKYSDSDDSLSPRRSRSKSKVGRTRAFADLLCAALCMPPRAPLSLKTPMRPGDEQGRGDDTASRFSWKPPQSGSSVTRGVGRSAARGTRGFR